MANILILEDDFLVSQDYKLALEQHGHSVTIVRTATEAIAHCRDAVVDLAIVDLFVVDRGRTIPDGGLTFISSIRLGQVPDQVTSPRVPIIAVSGGISISHGNNPLETAMILGASDQMQKPFSATALAERADKLLVG